MLARIVCEDFIVESKKFSMSERAFFFYRLIMIVFLMMGIVLVFLTSFLWGSFVCFPFLVIFLVMCYASWVLFRQPHEITLDDTQIIFKTFLGKVKMDLDDLISIECDRDKENRLNARVKSTQKSFRFNPALIEDWDEAMESIKTMNPNIEVKNVRTTNEQ